jgi:hypothetical protein
VTEHRDVGDREEAVAERGLDTLHDRNIFRDGWEAARLTRFDEIDTLRRERSEALLSAERAREERNREHVRLNAEWMVKCEELRKERDHYQMAAEAEAKFADEFRENAEAFRKDAERYQWLRDGGPEQIDMFYSEMLAP